MYNNNNMALQYYNITGTGQKYQLDKATGVAKMIEAIPQGGGTITWGGKNLPSELTAGLTTKLPSVPTTPTTPTTPVTPTTPTYVPPAESYADRTARLKSEEEARIKEEKRQGYLGQVASLTGKGTTTGAGTIELQEFYAGVPQEFQADIVSALGYTPLSAVNAPTQTLEPGDEGTEVEQLQTWLVSQGYMTKEQMATGPGTYGPQTKAAVAAYQEAKGIETKGNPGFYGPITKSYIAQAMGKTELIEGEDDITEKSLGQTEEQRRAAYAAAGLAYPGDDDVDEIIIPTEPTEPTEPTAPADYSNIFPDLIPYIESGSMTTDIARYITASRSEQVSKQKEEIKKYEQTLDRLTGLHKEYSIAKDVDDPTLVALEQAIEETTQTIEDFTPESYLETQPGAGFGLTQAYLERKVIAQRDPMIRQLSKMIYSASKLKDIEMAEEKSIMREIEAAQLGLATQKELAGLYADAATLPEKIQEKLLTEMLFPTKEKVTKPEKPTFVPGTEGRYQQVYNPETGEYEIRPTGLPAAEIGTSGAAEAFGLTSMDQILATNLVVKMYGRRAISKPELLNPVMQLMAEGKTPDEIEDIVRYSSESVLFQGVIRDAAESVGTDLSFAKRENLMNTIDRSLEEDDMDRVKEILKKSAIDSYDVATSNIIRGTDRTLLFLDEIEQDLKDYEKAGGNTNIFSGTWEKVHAKAGTVASPELRKIATKIAISIQRYRRAMTGAQFSIPEAAEYTKMFPGIDKTSSFNTATLGGLREVMRGDVEFYLGERMGYGAYSEIYGAPTTPAITEPDDLSAYLGGAGYGVPTPTAVSVPAPAPIAAPTPAISAGPRTMPTIPTAPTPEVKKATSLFGGWFKDYEPTTFQSIWDKYK